MPKPADDAVDLVMELERQVWDAWCKRDETALRELHDVDYVVADREGVFDWSAVVSGFMASELIGYDLRLARGHRTSEDVVTLVLHVRAEWGRAQPVKTIPLSVVSVWARRSGIWKSVLRHEIAL
jgi:hypothetical protein